MKKTFIFGTITALLSTLSPAPADAVQKCVALNSATTCTVPGRLATGYSNWTLSCTTKSTTQTISGVMACSTTQGAMYGTSTNLASTRLSTATDPDTCYIGDSLNCWCKMTSPAVSLWVFSGLTYQTESECLYNCAAGCQTYLSNETSLLNAMFSTLSD